jgi:hypothetical protein
VSKDAVPSYPAANIQDAGFLPVLETTPDQRLLFWTQVKEITTRTIHSKAADNPHVECHVAFGVPQLVEHCLGKRFHGGVKLRRPTKGRLSCLAPICDR